MVVSIEWQVKKLQMRTLTSVFLVVSRIIGGIETADGKLVQGELPRLIWVD